MAQGGGGKRKRGDRTYSHDSSNDGSRPSPHRPGNLNLAQQNYQYHGQQQYNFGRDQANQRSRGNRRGGYNGRGGAQGGQPRSPQDSPNAVQSQFRPGTSISGAMSPPSVPIQRAEELKQPATPRTPVSAVTASTQTIVSQPPPFPRYDYEYLTAEVVTSWTQSGRKAVIDLGVQTARDDSLGLGSIFQEIIRSGLDGRIDPKDAGGIVKDILSQTTPSDKPPGCLDLQEINPQIDATSLFLDCVSIMTESDSSSPVLPALMISTGIPPLTMRQQLESTLLHKIGLIRDTFTRMGIRKQTNLLYRQANYNLLREETEGYSKLMTELFTTSSNEPPTAEVVEDTFERVKGMIGTFDLDVGRVLDVTLDVFAAVLVKQYRFFVKYLRISSWWPEQETSAGGELTGSSYNCLPKWALPGASGWSVVSEEEKEELSRAKHERDTLFWNRVREIGMAAFFEIGGRSASGADTKILTSTDSEQDQSEAAEDRKWIEATGTLPPTSNKIAAQVLGFKLRFYSSSARDPSDVLPVNLIYLAALLIKIGFISLRDLYPHLWPADDAMEAVKEEKMKEKAEREKLNRPGGATNALMTAGALADDTLPPPGRMRESDSNRALPLKSEATTEKAVPASKGDDKEQLPEPLDQKVQLLKSLLCIGAIPEALYILGRFPWLPDAYPELPEHIHRILNHSLSKAYEALQPLRDRTELREAQKIIDPDQSSVPKGDIRRVDPPARKILRWAQLDKEDTNEGLDYRFYWDDWADNVPVCQTVDDVFTLCGSLLNISGVKIGQDPGLLIKLARIGSHSLANDTSEANKSRWIDLSKRLIVPALSLTKCNPGVVNEVFELIKKFPTRTRYLIYAEWYSGATSRLPDIMAAFSQARAETKDVLKRISKTNTKPMARALAKVAYASPGIVFSVTLAQIETYDNLVEVVVECGRYFTYLGYDVLTWSLMSALGAGGRDRVQADGMVTSRWLQALALFSGKIFKRYSTMSPTPILQYVTEQLRKDNSTDLIVLEEIITSMAGIISDTNFNESQVLAMAGGDVLQSQTLLQIHDRRHESKKVAERLMKSLVEPRLVGQLLISIAQQRQTCIFKVPEHDAHSKLLGNLFDEINRVLTQYLELLRSNMSVKEFDSLVPDVSELIGAFGIDPSVAFWISRPSISAAMASYDDKVEQKKKAASKQLSTAIANGQEVEMVDGEMEERISGTLVETVQIDQTSNEPENVDPDTIMETRVEESGSTQPMNSNSTQANKAVQACHPVLQDIVEPIRNVLPSRTWEVLSVPFYVTFWQLSLCDLFVGTSDYQDENNRLQKKISLINSDRSDISAAGTQKKEREKKGIMELQRSLQTELKEQVAMLSSTRTRLSNEKDHWFANSWGKWDALNIALIEHCFFPRMLISPTDAVYTFRLLKLLHSSGAANFRTMGVLDQIFNEKRLTSMIFLCTSKEAENMGRFLNEILRDLAKWHADKALFEKEAYGTKKDLPGFSKKMNSPKSISTFWTYEDFRRVLLKWHRNLNTALKACITGGEYMHIRNAIMILRAIYLYFPAINWMGQSQVAGIEELAKSESRGDLKLAAASLLGNLKRREKDWMLPQAFNLNEGSTNGTNGARANSAKPLTPQRETDPKTILDAKAPEFMPGSHGHHHETTKLALATSGKLEVEDGEIDDATIASSNSKEVTTMNPFNTPRVAPEKTHSSTSIPQKPEPPPKPPQEALPSPESILQQSKRSIIPPTTSSSLQTPGSTPRPIAPTIDSRPSIPTRPETNRNVSESSAHNRPMHSLPNRPEASNSRLNDHNGSDRLPDRALRESRESHFPGSHHNEMFNETPRERNENHVSNSHYRSQDRPMDRPHLRERDQGWNDKKGLPARPSAEERHTELVSRDVKISSREARSDRIPQDKSHPDSLVNTRQTDGQGRTSRDPSMAPPRSSISHHPDRAALINGPQDQDRGHAVPHSDRRADSLRYDSYPNSQRGSRNTSPSRRDDSRPNRYDGHHDRDDRLSLDHRRFSEDGSRTHSLRTDESHPPIGPRTDRALEAPTAGDRFRETLRGQPLNNPPPTDLSHGRLNQDYNGSSHRSEPQYGRLITTGPEIPSGPRLANGSHGPAIRSGGRNVSAPQPHVNTQQPAVSQNSVPSPTIPSRGAPTGPSSTRAAPRDSVQFNRPSSASSSLPPTPVTEAPDVAGIHPDRLKAIHGPGVSASNSTAPVHVQSNSNLTNNRPLPPPISVPSQTMQRAPNGTQPPSPLAPSRQGPPTGPSFVSDRNRGNKIFAGIQNVLQQSVTPNFDRSNQGTSIRGRGGRTNSAMNHSSSSPLTAGPPTPSTGRQQDTFPTRADLFTGSGRSNTQGADDSNYGRDNRRDRPRDDGDRRSTRRRSRSPNRDHQPSIVQQSLPFTATRPEDTRSPRNTDHRQREHVVAGRANTNNTSAIHTNGTDARVPQQPGQPQQSSMTVNTAPVSSVRRSNRDVDKDRDRRPDVERRDLTGHPEDWDRDRERRGDSRRDERDRERRDGGRKRRGEDGVGLESGPGERGYGGDGKRRRNG